MTVQSRYIGGPVPSHSKEKISPMVQLEKNDSTMVAFSIGGYSYSKKTVTIHLNYQMLNPKSNSYYREGQGWIYGDDKYENIIYSFTINVDDLQEELRNVKTRVIGQGEKASLEYGNKYYITIKNYTVNEAAADNFNRRHFNNLFASAMAGLAENRNFYEDVQRHMAFNETIWPDFEMKQSKNSSYNTSIELSESFARTLGSIFG
jgi:hypothetical protein